jgi:hypothetical protein
VYTLTLHRKLDQSRRRQEGVWGNGRHSIFHPFLIHCAVFLWQTDPCVDWQVRAYEEGSAGSSLNAI